MDTQNYSKINHHKWTSQDRGWMLNLFGAAIGAGILYLPINAGIHGIWPLIILLLLSGPMVFFAHNNLVRFCLSSSDLKANITTTVKEHFGNSTGRWLTFLYTLSIYPIVLLYAIGLTNVTLSFIENQLGIENISRSILSLILIVTLSIIVHLSEQWMLKAIKFLCYPLVTVLIGISLYLIPYWDFSSFNQPIDISTTIKAIFLTIPLLIFSFNHSPACSAFATTYRISYPDNHMYAKKTYHILKRNTQLLILTVFLFIFSCIFTLSPEDLQNAKVDNLPVLSILANKIENPFFSILVPCIAFLAIASSWFGVYLGSLEGFQGLVIQECLKHMPEKRVNAKLLKLGCSLFIILTCWFSSYMDWSVIQMVEIFVVPILASILYIMPVYAFYTIPKLKTFRHPMKDIFTVLIGITAISAFFINQLL